LQPVLLIPAVHLCDALHQIANLHFGQLLEGRVPDLQDQGSKQLVDTTLLLQQSLGVVRNVRTNSYPALPCFHHTQQHTIALSQHTTQHRTLECGPAKHAGAQVVRHALEDKCAHHPWATTTPK
jgi:hypothetical protein